jgi:hypothetical protein
MVQAAALQGVQFKPQFAADNDDITSPEAMFGQHHLVTHLHISSMCAHTIRVLTLARARAGMHVTAVQTCV